MNQALYLRIAKSTANRPSRNHHAGMFFENPASPGIAATDAS
jgi:hypothetical protein